jgi:hypothetical protein
MVWRDDLSNSGTDAAPQATAAEQEIREVAQKPWIDVARRLHDTLALTVTARA